MNEDIFTALTASETSPKLKNKNKDSYEDRPKTNIINMKFSDLKKRIELFRKKTPSAKNTLQVVNNPA